MGVERGWDLVERLAPDDAADSLAEFPAAEAERLLNLMPAEESRPIRDLLRYAPETAGGMMTNEVLSLAQDLTAEEALGYLRQHSAHMEMIYNLYIVDSEKHLAGVVSLRELVVAEPTTLLRDLMDRNVISVTTDTDQEEVAHIIAKYDLLGVPVVDSGHHLVGLITVDDVIDVLHEEQAEDFSEIAGASVEEFEEEESHTWRAALSRVTWLAVNVLAGLALAGLPYQAAGSVFAPAVTHLPVFGPATDFRSPLALSGALLFITLAFVISGQLGPPAPVSA